MGPLDASTCACNEPGNQAARQKGTQNKDQVIEKREKTNKKLCA
jgi:hypothetical protein